MVLTSEIYYITFECSKLGKKAHVISDFIKKISPQVGLEPTKMRHDLKKSVSILPEGEEKIISFISYFSCMVFFGGSLVYLEPHNNF